MPKKARPRPLDEGPLKNIYEWFFQPIVEKYAEEDQTAHSFLEELFDVDHRHIEQYQCVKLFKMPGLYYAAARVKLQGAGPRRITRGTLLMVRQDDRSQDVDVEFTAAGEDHVFCLTQSEWEWVRLHLKSEGLRANKSRHRNRMRRRGVRRNNQVPGLKGQGKESKV
jgi:hypothetical protein